MKSLIACKHTKNKLWSLTMIICNVVDGEKFKISGNPMFTELFTSDETKLCLNLKKVPAELNFLT